MKYLRQLSAGANNVVIALSLTTEPTRSNVGSYGMYDVFADEVAQLHQAGFVHRELKRPSELDGLAFDNILLTENGLRLIDVGIYALGTQVGERIFARYLETEQIEMIQFRDYFLTR